MDMSSLFPADGGIGSVLSARPTPHVSFKAGVLTRDQTTNLVTADARKGVFQIITSPEDNLLHLQWRAKNQATVDHDLIIFNAETEMKLVTSCPASARVYVLKWRGNDQRMFFWMQGRDPSADPALIARVNAILENGPDNQQYTRSIETPQEPNPTPTDSDVVMQPQSTQQLPANPPPQAPGTAPATESVPITLEQLRAALPLGRNRAGATDDLRGPLAEAEREKMLTTPTILELLNPDTLTTALEDPRVQAALPPLLEHLPEQDRSVDRITEILRSPPLRSQAAALTNALQSDQAAELIRTFELPAVPGSDGYGLSAFIEALLQLERQSKEPRED